MKWETGSFFPPVKHIKLIRFFWFRCEHIINVMKFKNMDISKMTPTRRTLSTRLVRQRLENRTTGHKRPGRFDRASADQQVREDPRIQLILERRDEELRVTPSESELVQSALN